MHELVLAHATADVEEYAAQATPFLVREPVERNVLLTVIEQARQHWPGWTAPPQFWWMTDGTQVVAAASWTPPFPLLVSSMPAEATGPLAEAAVHRAAELGVHVRGVTGPTRTSRTIAEAIAARTGRRVVEDMRMIVHELASIVDVPRPGGEARQATRSDAPLVVAWMRAFGVEAHAAVGGDIEATVSARIDAARIWLWVDGAPCSTATLYPVVGGIVRIGGVYTPPPEREHGYARRLVHDVSVAALRAPGVRGCTLNTDVANPVSNAIYAQVGYVPVAEHTEFGLVAC